MATNHYAGNTWVDDGSSAPELGGQLLRPAERDEPDRDRDPHGADRHDPATRADGPDLRELVDAGSHRRGQGRGPDRHHARQRRPGRLPHAHRRPDPPAWQHRLRGQHLGRRPLGRGDRQGRPRLPAQTSARAPIRSRAASAAADGLTVQDKNAMLPIANPAPLLRKATRLPSGKVDSARLYVSGAGYYDMTVNGRALTTDGRRRSARRVEQAAARVRPGHLRPHGLLRHLRRHPARRRRRRQRPGRRARPWLVRRHHPAGVVLAARPLRRRAAPAREARRHVPRRQDAHRRLRRRPGRPPTGRPRSTPSTAARSTTPRAPSSSATGAATATGPGRDWQPASLMLEPGSCSGPQPTCHGVLPPLASQRPAGFRAGAAARPRGRAGAGQPGQGPGRDHRDASPAPACGSWTSGRSSPAFPSSTCGVRRRAGVTAAHARRQQRLAAPARPHRRSSSTRRTTSTTPTCRRTTTRSAGRHGRRGSREFSHWGFRYMEIRNLEAVLGREPDLAATPAASA